MLADDCKVVGSVTAERAQFISPSCTDAEFLVQLYNIHVSSCVVLNATTKVRSMYSSKEFNWKIRTGQSSGIANSNYFD